MKSFGNKASGKDSDDDDSDLESIGEPQIGNLKNTKQLEAAYAENPYSLEIAQKLLKIYSDKGELEKLTALRQSLLAVFTLPESTLQPDS